MFEQFDGILGSYLHTNNTLRFSTELILAAIVFTTDRLIAAGVIQVEFNPN